MRLTYAAPVPLQAGCSASYWFPTVYYDAAEITELRTGTLFAAAAVSYLPAGSGGANEFTVADIPPAETGGVAYKSVTFSGCLDFRRQRPETTTIFGLTQPTSTKPTASLQVYIRDSRGETVAYFNSGVSFTPVTGSMALVSASLDPATVYAAAALTWTIQPSHNLYAADSPSLTIEVPTDYSVPGVCTTTAANGDPYGASRACSTNTIQNTLTISNLVASDWVGGGTLSFTTSAVTLPTTSAGG